ncbi:ABC transporter substrate-binding protein [Thermus oshimai]|uniref:ABC transporter substrate-binding protein n=1 Tax=Thermus oshimai TaxID=56957 RepID=UPI0014614560|nr:ABC transporter substrate-binding protein [Thermus oshimai]
MLAATCKAAWAQGGARLRIGVVLPLRTGPTPLEVFSSEIAGEAARLGALLALEEVEAVGGGLEVLIASAPDAASASRAALRLVARHEVFALIGGFSEEALALGRLAEKQGVLFFNIGSASDTLRSEVCSRHTFHIEASAAMYLDALAEGFTALGVRRWFLVYEDTLEGQARYQRAWKALERKGGLEVGKALVAPGKLEFSSEYMAILEAKPEAVLLMLNPLAQLNFLAQYGDDSRFQTTKLILFPEPSTQTRAFLSTLRQAVSQFSGYLVTLWEGSLGTLLNERFSSRWGRPMDPSAWAAYAAVKIVLESVLATGSPEPARLVAYLEDPRTRFDLHKGTPLSFRPWDHQLRQPLYLVRLNPEAEIGIRLSQQLALAQLVAQVPEIPSGADPLPILDQLGDSAQRPSCR